MKKFFLLLAIMPCLCACHALFTADHVKYAGGVYDKNRCVNVSDTSITSSIPQ